MVKMDNIVVPSVNTTAFSVSPSCWSENVEASPAVGIASAIKNPIIIFSSIFNTSFNANKIPTPNAGNTTSFIPDTKYILQPVNSAPNFTPAIFIPNIVIDIGVTILLKCVENVATSGT